MATPFATVSERQFPCTGGSQNTTLFPTFNLFHYSYRPTFGMVAFSKPLDSQAHAAIMEAFRLDKEEESQRELERRAKEDAKNRTAKERARAINKANICP